MASKKSHMFGGIIKQFSFLIVFLSLFFSNIFGAIVPYQRATTALSWKIIDKNGCEVLFEINNVDSICEAGDVFVAAFASIFSEIRRDDLANAWSAWQADILSGKTSKLLRDCLIWVTASIDGKVVALAFFKDPIKSFWRLMQELYEKEDLKSLWWYKSPSALDDGERYLDLLAVHPDVQGHGLARHLIFSILRMFPETKRLWLETSRDERNRRTVKIYDHLGFRQRKVEWPFTLAGNLDGFYIFEWQNPATNIPKQVWVVYDFTMIERMLRTINKRALLLKNR